MTEPTVRTRSFRFSRSFGSLPVSRMIKALRVCLTTVAASAALIIAPPEVRGGARRFRQGGRHQAR